MATGGEDGYRVLSYFSIPTVAQIMRKVKIFKSVESELSALESDINQWIESEGVELVSIAGNIAPQTHLPTAPDTFSVSDVLVILTYEVPHGKV